MAQRNLGRNVTPFVRCSTRRFPSDPTRPSVELKTARESIRTTVKVQCRWHDLRHTVCTKMAESGFPESTMLAIMGRMSRKMLERYSHIRMAAKRQAVEALRLPSRTVFSDEVPTKAPQSRQTQKLNNRKLLIYW